MAQSRNEAALENILGASNVLEAPTSRNEKILQNLLGGTFPLDEPVSRIETLLMQLVEQEFVPKDSVYEDVIAESFGGDE